jgi:hypothetical protein
MKKLFIALCTVFALTLGVFSPVIAADIPDEQLTTLLLEPIRRI